MTTSGNSQSNDSVEMLPVPGYIPEYSGICSII